ncbi:hypothetical protein J2W22_002610 [Sphingomonas kyeonggiensis]|uniref:hypothetical protein n=1 Tax=Sphingomonas kyeonggiensis TaxID=1268553 RepID=UPI002787F75E|nr:hypothetical protein [Sphingomonas kyeonggiensis]MDQ0250546.1 hypothetical protein [Sphingomonas kyeonggiensis]
MMKLKLAALLAAGTLTFGTGAAMAAPQDRTPPRTEKAQGPRHNPIDLNKDGFVSRDEWMKAAAARFERYDVSKDGKLSREELRFGRFEQMRRHGRGHGGRGGWHRGPHGGPQGGHGFGPGREGPGGPGHRMGPPPPPPADAPAPNAPAPAGN